MAKDSPFRVVMAQLDFLVGDIARNAERIIAAAAEARDRLHADLIVFPELTLTGYPPEDLLLRPAFIAQVEPALQHLCASISGIAAVYQRHEFMVERKAATELWSDHVDGILRAVREEERTRGAPECGLSACSR